jgi:hypothetical protein
MAETAKRKVRRSRHRRAPVRIFSHAGTRFFAPIVGQDPRELHAFVLVDQGQRLSLFEDPERDVYLREL